MIQININDISNKVRTTLLTGLNTALTGAITATDTVLEAFGKIQNQLNGKENTITTLPISKGGTNSGTALNNNRVMQSSGGAIVEAPAITANRALVSDANGIPTASSVTDTTLGFLDATSSVQTQLNKRSIILDATADLYTATGATSTLSVYSFTIPANALPSKCLLNMEYYIERTSGTASTINCSLFFNTTNNFATATRIALSGNMAVTQFSNAIVRTFSVNGNNLRGLLSSNAVNSDMGVNTGASQVHTIDRTNDIFIFVAITRTNTADEALLSRGKTILYIQ